MPYRFILELSVLTFIPKSRAACAWCPPVSSRALYQTNFKAAQLAGQINSVTDVGVWRHFQAFYFFE
jgi:hypothetical protein